MEPETEISNVTSQFYPYFELIKIIEMVCLIAMSIIDIKMHVLYAYSSQSIAIVRICNP